jgi:hypothetical protein
MPGLAAAVRLEVPETAVAQAATGEVAQAADLGEEPAVVAVEAVTPRRSR